MFSDNDRRIFEYFDGAGMVKGDPLTIHRRLAFCLDGRPNDLLNEMHSQDMAQSHLAKEKVITAVREVFELVPFDKATGAGAMEEDVWNALDCFLEWSEKNAPSGES